MSIQRPNWTIAEIVYDFSDDLSVPEDWLDLISRLHPLTACVVWEVLTGRLTPAVVELAQASPDVERYRLVKLIAEADPQHVGQVLEDARQAMDEVFLRVLPDDPRRIVH